MSLRFDSVRQRLYDDAGRRYDPATRAWGADDSATGAPIDVVDAATWLQRSSGHPWRAPVGVIGPRAARDAQMRVAESVGHGLARMGFTILCGGRDGVMTAVAKGARSAGGTTVGLLPETDASVANPYIDIAIATGIGEARNALIARASLCLVAVGNSHGTLSEVALSRHFGKLVIGLEDAAQVDGVRHVADATAALRMVAQFAVGRLDAAD
jgi:uncharacterized protein (TIGR00725 family)